MGSILHIRVCILCGKYVKKKEWKYGLSLKLKNLNGIWKHYGISRKIDTNNLKWRISAYSCAFQNFLPLRIICEKFSNFHEIRVIVQNIISKGMFPVWILSSLHSQYSLILLIQGRDGLEPSVNGMMLNYPFWALVVLIENSDLKPSILYYPFLLNI